MVLAYALAVRRMERLIEGIKFQAPIYNLQLQMPAGSDERGTMNDERGRRSWTGLNYPSWLNGSEKTIRIPEPVNPVAGLSVRFEKMTKSLERKIDRLAEAVDNWSGSQLRVTGFELKGTDIRGSMVRETAAAGKRKL